MGVLTILYKGFLKEIFHTKMKVLSALHPPLFPKLSEFLVK